MYTITYYTTPLNLSQPSCLKSLSQLNWLQPMCYAQHCTPAQLQYRTGSVWAGFIPEENDLIGRQPHRKTTSQEDNLTVR